MGAFFFMMATSHVLIVCECVCVCVENNYEIIF